MNLRTTGRIFCSLILVSGWLSLRAQVATQLEKAAMTFGADPALKHASWSLLVVETQTGKTVYAFDADRALAPASTQKILTSIAGFELLGKDFRYTTSVSYNGSGSLVLEGSGDPSFGSWRFPQTKAEVLLDRLKAFAGKMTADTSGWNDESLPDGWIWQDIGNYYGAGARKFNWRENQYDILLQSGTSVGSPVVINGTRPALAGIELVSHATAAPKGSGDNAYIYLAPGSDTGVVRGTIPAGENNFSISGALHEPFQQFEAEFNAMQLNIAGSKLNDTVNKRIFTHYSPSYDSLNYWFLRKSINLYGEAFLKTMAVRKSGRGTTEEGANLLNRFWQEKGIDAGALQILDGSGLSPQNRVTTRALVTALQFARKQAWYPAFYEALPLYNGMKLKSGSINGSRAFAGYHTAANGRQYTLAIIVNNYSGGAGEMVKKMFRLLDHVK